MASRSSPRCSPVDGILPKACLGRRNLAQGMQLCRLLLLLSAAAALRHPYFLLGGDRAAAVLSKLQLTK